MKYLIFGNGWIGNKFKEFLGEDAFCCAGHIESKEDIISSLVYSKFKNYPDVVINCIGKTGRPNIDWCEDHKDETFESNVIVPYYIASVCKERNIYMVHMSSGCIYEDGPEEYIEHVTFPQEFWTEEDSPNFTGSFYSRTKIMAENILKEFDNVLQLRIRMPIDSDDNPKNLLNKLLKYDSIINIPNSITVVPDFLKIAKELMNKKATGIFNIVNDRPLIHGQILDTYCTETGKDIKHKEQINLEGLYKTVKAERSNCTLSTDKLKSLGIEVPDSVESLKKLFKEMKNVNTG